MSSSRGLPSSSQKQRQAVIDSVTDALNLDVNPVARYFLWLGDVLQGDFGISARTQQPVIDELATRVPLTLKLVAAALILSVLIGTCVGSSLSRARCCTRRSSR